MRESIILQIDNPTKWAQWLVQTHYENLCDDIAEKAIGDDILWDELAKGDDAAGPMRITLTGMPKGDSIDLNGEWDVYEVMVDEGDCGY